MPSKKPQCPRCGAEVLNRATWCFNCNMKLHWTPAPPPLPGPPRRVRERRSESLASCIGRSAAALLLASLIIAAVVFVIGYLAPMFIKARQSAKLAELKTELHEIQLAVERFNEDHSTYPPYLIGGEARWARRVELIDEDSPFGEIQNCPTESLADPLLRMGYLDRYPVNPFLLSANALHIWQQRAAALRYSGDPLRNGSPDGQLHGTRFGAGCNRMGNLLGDPRYGTYFYDLTGQAERQPTFCDVDLRASDAWTSRELSVKGNLPGQFFYKSCGLPDLDGGEQFESEAPQPRHCDRYLLGGFGEYRQRGQDVLGRENPLKLRPGGAETGSEAQLWLWTRSEISDNPAYREGSPWRALSSNKADYVLPGNPNGVGDGVVLLLQSSPHEPAAGK